MKAQVAIMALLKLKNIRKSNLREIIETSDLFNKDLNELYEIVREKLKSSQNFNEWKKIYKISSNEFLQAELFDIKIITILDKEFPDQLKKIPDPPMILFGKGDISLLKFPSQVAVVGTRYPTSYGSQLSYEISSQLTQNSILIVSGLALGIDTQAHLGCLQNQGKTISVLSHGLDYIYPPENKVLAQKIIDNGGLLLSEYPPGTKPKKFRFLARNRIQSGLSQAVVVIEAKKGGGTTTTIKHCIKQGKILYCVNPGNEGNKADFAANFFFIENGNAKSLENGEIQDLLQDIRNTN
ncbi:unnamed protein product [Blepharisma stoltei]|uniref:Smf/DprA SLOG domain-containing protein n=1 Tax=Blepharisma stoltei TaxID=1481888 RepID=A0AAU9IY39_9CILI|nr:unnamed protein product [Blepharisma stoltei]